MKHMGISWKRTGVLVWAILAILLISSVSATSPKQTTTSSCPESDKPSSSVSLYILIDESKTANLDDRDGAIRFSMLSTIIEFSVGYGWLVDAPPVIYIFKYRDGLDDPTTTGPRDFTQPLWPADKSSKRVALITTPSNNNLTSLINEIRPSIRRDHSTDPMFREHLPTTFKYITELVKANGNQQNTIVILVTQGELREENAAGKTIDSFLREAKDAWLPSGIKMGIFKFDDLHEENWRNQFVIPLAENPETYIHTCCDRNIWNGMIKIYQDKGFLPKDGSPDAVSLGHINGGSNRYEFSSPLENLRVVSLDINEGVIVNGNSGNSVQDLRWWGFENLSEGWVSSLYSPLQQIQFLYTCNLAVTPPPTETSIPTPPSTQPSTGIKRILEFPDVKGGIIAMSAIIIIYIILWILYQKTQKWEPLEYISRLLCVADILLLLRLFLFVGGFEEIIRSIASDFAADTLMRTILLIINPVFAGLGLPLLNKFFPRPTPSDDSDGVYKGNTFAKLSPITIGAFVFLMAVVTHT